MSDERFDQDLRSVLLEDTPRDVPDDLRRRVAAVAATNPAPSRPSLWRFSLPLPVGAVGALVVVLAFGWWRFGSTTPDVGSRPSATPTGASASPAPSPSSSVVAGVMACRPADLTARITRWEGAAGSRIAAIEVDNVTASPCLVPKTPALQLVDATGRVLIDAASAAPGPTLEVAAGARLRTEVLVSNYCGPTPVPPIDIAVSLSPGSRLVANPAPGVSSAEAVPPCLGSTGSQITMNGWGP